MAVWRRRALKMFPELRHDLNAGRYDVYMLYFDLLPRVRDAHRSRSFDRLRAIYSFAHWCFHQKDGDLRNAAEVAFYEHLFDEWDLREEVIPWLAPDVIEACCQLWDTRLTLVRRFQLRRLLRRERREIRRDAV